MVQFALTTTTTTIIIIIMIIMTIERAEGDLSAPLHFTLFTKPNEFISKMGRKVGK